MEKTSTGGATDAQGDSVVLMYPDNQLKDQVRDFSETLSVFAVLKAEFFDKH